MSADKTPFLEAVEQRRSYYSLSAESPIPDSRVKELVEFTIKHCPSTYNVQSARAVILTGDKHKKLWDDIVPKHMKTVMPEDKYVHFEPRIKGFAAAYGSVMFFEDEKALEALGQKNAMVLPMLPEWSRHSTGLHQFTLWCALEAEGLGCNLQHFNFHPGIVADIKKEWNLPEEWTLHAQLVYGKIAAPAMERTYEALDKRVIVA